MKRFLFQLSILIGIVVLFSTTSCNNDDDLLIQTTGNLIINARDGRGLSIVGETVYLYDNSADFNASPRRYMSTRRTDNSGQVRWINLTPGIYYFDLDFENQAGGFTRLSGSTRIEAGIETTVTLSP
ncbi:MAG: hypothetical protein JJT94_04980 [Bernardetiaceae bacterium]|nr:hypothetical protein [Bernardetiaceae bacterium]